MSIEFHYIFIPKQTSMHVCSSRIGIFAYCDTREREIKKTRNGMGGTIEHSSVARVRNYDICLELLEPEY